MARKISKIAVVTGNRSEYGILRPLVQKLDKSKDLSVFILATGTHTIPEYGSTIDEIRKDCSCPVFGCEMYDESITGDHYFSSGLSKGIESASKIFNKELPDLVVVLGDRLEALAGCLAAACLKIPIAHIHGGDKTDDGHIDESIRHSISRFSHLHFTAVADHAERLIRMGESPRRVHNVGALGLDSIVAKKNSRRKDVLPKIFCEDFMNDRIALCLFHSTDDIEQHAHKDVETIFDCLESLNTSSIWIHPNNDKGNTRVVEVIKKMSKNAKVKSFINLEHDDYVSLLSCVDVLVGNSSSGIIEAASLEIPVVNIGSRNKDRIASENVVFSGTRREEILSAIDKTLNDKAFKNRVRKVQNVYGDGDTADKIINILKKVNIDDYFVKKLIEY